MGQRANYALVEDGKLSLFYSHWGANTVDLDFFWGPEHALAFVAQQDAKDPATEWLDEIWCEGGALIDVTQRRLMIFGGEDIRFEPLRHRLTFALMRRIWSGWTVSWAREGLGDVVDALGLSRDLVRSGKPRELDGPLLRRVPFQTTVLSTDRGLYTLYDLPTAVLRHPLSELDAFPAGAATMVRPLHGKGSVRAGLHLDFARKRADLWQVDDAQDELVGWDGWTVVHHEDRFEAQLGLAPGLRLTTAPRSSIVTDLSASLLSTTSFDPAALLATMKTTMNVSDVNPSFTSYHPRKLPEDERARVLARALRDLETDLETDLEAELEADLGALPSLWEGDVDGG